MSYHPKFPNPPKFKSSLNKVNFEVPKYYGFDHPCTKWILGSIVSNQALFRLLKVAASYQCILKRYHQVPDIPSLIMKDQFNGDRAAFDKQAILYLTPLAISIYMKYEDALTQLVGLKDSSGLTLIDPNDLCFVQNFWRKGDTRYFSDLISTFPAIIAIRRNYFTAFRFLLMAGYCPNDSFSITYRKPHRELVIFYKDLIDYVIDYLKRRPALNVSQLMNVLLQPSLGGMNNLDIFCFDYSPSVTPNLISLFQRITRTALEEDNLSEESGMHIINILEKIQEAGFFLGLRNSVSKDASRSIELDQLIKQKKDNKIKIGDLQQLKDATLSGLLKKDFEYCMSYIIIWLQTKSLKRKTEQTTHLMKLLTKIMFDTKLLESFFKTNTSSNEELLKKLSELPNLSGNLEMKTVTAIVNFVVQIYQQSETMITAFISMYKTEPIKILFGYMENPMKTKPKDSNKNNWIKTELSDQMFRDKYLKCKELNKQSSDENKSNAVEHYNRDKLFLNCCNTKFQTPDKNNKKIRFQSSPSNSDDYFYLSTRSSKLRSISSNCLNSVNKDKIEESNTEFTTNSAKSLVGLDANDTISISNIFDPNNLTTIEIDLAELKKTKRMFSEVVITSSDEDPHKKIPVMPDIISSSTLTNSLKNSENVPPPPPLKEHKYKHKIKSNY